MKHAGPEALNRLEPLLRKLRAHEGLKEKSHGCFYRGSKGFLHIHEHGDEFFADVRFNEDFERFAFTSAAQQSSLLKKVAAFLADGTATKPRSSLGGRKRKPS